MLVLKLVASIFTIVLGICLAMISFPFAFIITLIRLGMQGSDSFFYGLERLHNFISPEEGATREQGNE